MGLEKAIEHKKEHRKKYIGSKSFDKTCRNHGGCDWCKENRLYHSNKDKEFCDSRMKDWKSGKTDYNEE